MKEIYMVISEYIADRKLSMEDVAKLCGWPSSKLNAILNGFQKLNAADYGILCEKLGVSYDYFYHWTVKSFTLRS